MALSERIMSMTGIEFENLCYALLSKMGFSVETTKTSGDGGIDLIAHNPAPFVQGKYVVQCKRYSGTVGVPIIRDLYGVVTAERANKGILITTGYFTVSAVNFAEDKNIELIDAERLSVLLGENGLQETFASKKGVFFLRNPHFDNDKFEYYKGLITRNMITQDLAHDFIFNFLFEYLEKPDAKPNNASYEMIYNGLGEEFSRMFDWYEKKYLAKGKKEQKICPYYIQKYKGLSQLYNFDLFDYVQSRYEILKNHQRLEFWTNFEREQGAYYNIDELSDELFSKVAKAVYTKNWSNVKYSCGYTYYETINLLSLFHYFSIEKGSKFIEKNLRGYVKNNNPTILKMIIMRMAPYYQEACTSLMLLSPSITVLNGYQGIVGFIHSDKDVTIQTSHKTLVPIKEYYDKYAEINKDKIDNEIKKINVLLDTLK